MKKIDTLLSNERPDVHMIDIISQLVAMNKEDIQKVLDHRKKELHDFAPDLYKVLYDISTFHSLKTDWEREELFHKVEKEVLADLPENIRDKITGRRKLLDEKDDKYQKDYREFIVLLYTKEIFLTPKEALFTGANIAVQYQELRFPSETGCIKKSYQGFDGKKVIREEINRKAFSEKNPHHARCMEVIAAVKDQGKYILTKEDIEKIVAAYSGWKYDRLSAFIYCLSGPGNFILDCKTRIRYYDAYPYEFKEDELPFLLLQEDGKYQTYSQDVDRSDMFRETTGSFLLARNI